ncbi:MAG: hypothetical protein V3U26_05495 [Dehalococcoidia bacterium]
MATKRVGIVLLSGLAIALALSACGGGGKTSTATSPTPAPTQIPPSPTPTSQTALPEELFLEVTEPSDESTVREVPLVVVGRTTPDAVISVDGQTTDVNAQGEFVALVSLEPGPNVIEVVASDLTGRQETALMAVIYIP